MGPVGDFLDSGDVQQLMKPGEEKKTSQRPRVIGHLVRGVYFWWAPELIVIAL